MKNPGSIRKLSPIREQPSPASSNRSNRAGAFVERLRCTTNAIASSIASGLNMRCSSTRFSAPVAVASAAASISSNSSTVIRPCSSAPTDHSPTANAANQTVDCDNGILSACHRNRATQLSSNKNWMAPNHATRGLTGGW